MSQEAEKLKKRETGIETKAGVETKPELPQAPENLEQDSENLEQLREREAAKVEIGKIEIGAVGESADSNSAEIESAKEDEKLKEEVRIFFRQIILNSNEPERQEIEDALRRIAAENEIKFDEIIDESYKLRDDIVKMIKAKRFDAEIIRKIEKWLLLIFPKGKMFCTQAALNLANEVKEHWGLG